MGAAVRRDIFLQIGGSASGLETASKAGRTALLNLGTTADDIAHEVEKAFADLDTSGAENSARKMEQTFQRTFSAIQANARKVMDAPSPAAATQILNVAGAERAAKAAEVEAAAMRKLADGSAAVAVKAGDAGAAQRVLAVGFETAAVQAEQQAAALRTQASILAEVAAEAGIAAEADDDAMKKITKGTGQASIAKAEFQHVLRSASDSYAAGLPLTQIFTMELGRLAEAAAFYGQSMGGTKEESKGFTEGATEAGAGALEAGQKAKEAGELVHGFGGKMAAVGEFMGGPWGLAITMAISVLAPFIAKVVEGGHALDDEVKKLEENAEKTDTAEQAKRIFAQTEAGIAADIRGVTQELDKQNESLRTNAERLNIKARTDLNTETARRPAAAAAAAAAHDSLRAVEADAPATSGGADARVHQTRLAAARQAAADADAALAAIDKNITSATVAYERSQISLASERGKRSTDHIASINKFYDDKIAGVLVKAEQFRSQGKKQSDINTAVTQATAYWEERRKAALKAEQERERDAKQKPPSLGTQVDAARSGELLASAEHYRGLSETRDASALEDLFAKANLHVDPAKTAWCAAFVNAVLATNGLPGTGRLDARSFATYGEATSKPVAGDIVVSRRGTGSQGHVGFFQGTDASGNILVLGGNTGDKVGTERVRKEDVLAFRRAGGGTHGPSAETMEHREQAAKDKAAHDAEAFGQLRSRAEEDGLRLMRQRVTDYATGADLDRQQVDVERDRLDAAVQLGVGTRRWSQAEADGLIALNARNAALKKEAIDRAELAHHVEVMATADEHARDAHDGLLQIDLDMATTRRDRLALERQLLADSQAERRARLQRIWDDPTSSDDQAAQAAADLGRLPAQDAAERSQLDRRYQSPMAGYREQLRGDVGDMSDALEGVEVDGIKGVSDGLLEIAGRTKTVAGAFRDMAMSVLADLEKIAIEKALLAVLGLSTGGKVPGFAEGGVPGYAGGGDPSVDRGIISGAGTGTSDSILAMVGRKPIRLSNGEGIVNARGVRKHWPLIDAINRDRLPAFATGGLVDPSAIYMRPLPAAGSLARAAAQPQYIYVAVDKSALFEAHVTRIAAPMAQAAMVGGAQQASQDAADRAWSQIP